MTAVSIITACYNSAAYLPDTARSVFDQTFSDWEWIIVDDCSTDTSADIIATLAGRDSRVKAVRLNENSGAAVSRNVGIEASRGRYIAFLDSDDLWSPQKLARQLSWMSEYGHALTHSYYEQIEENGRRTGRVVRAPDRLSYRQMLRFNRIGCLTAIYDTSLLGKVYMPLLRKRQDYGLWLKILKLCPEAICFPEVLAYYRVRSGSISRGKSGLIKYNWQLYRAVEELSVMRSAYYLGWNVIGKVLK